MAKTRLVIDTDAVTDDVRAVSLALQHSNSEVLAITTVAGCVPVEQAVANMVRTLRANNVTGVPIFKGASKPLILNNHTRHNEKILFGNDGLGDHPTEFPTVRPDDYNGHQHEIPAAIALIDLFRKNRDLTLVCLGPLTNIALAIKLEPRFCEWPRKIVVMGGNIYGKGNISPNSTAEFNFSMDPEAAFIVINEMKCKITVIPWEAFLHESKVSTVDFHAHLKLDAPLARYFEMVTRRGRKTLSKVDRQYGYCDEVAMGVALDPDSLVLKEKVLQASVELHGALTRGQMAIDWMEGIFPETMSASIHRINSHVSFVLAYDVKVLDEMIFETIRRSEERRKRLELL
ncbi:unnamed protein product [Bursaphelenchus okinawaensis]|uniref:Inosine/uridine-preferring nucleoside hydrolase domain-containing protein n=1 Tax=Bursaphelenchus okinawaensis TaxID=465554 RepID=A0A811K5C5_9BILA|nr:unnamed protein product [Bursaphelenchus okinawaensis]CAG9091589.1 unnamed protein product [Bursaphelenchus okinawaensis]